MALERTDYYTMDTIVNDGAADDVEIFYKVGTVHIEPIYDDPQFGEDVMKEIQQYKQMQENHLTAITSLNRYIERVQKIESELIDYINQLKRGPTWTIAESLASMIGYKINYD